MAQRALRLPVLPATAHAAVRPLQAVLGLAAWAGAWAAQAAWTGGERATVPLMLGVAGLAAVLAWGAQPLRAGIVPSGAARPWFVPPDRTRLERLGGLAGVAGLTLLADGLFLALPPSTVGLPGLLWLASMALLVAVTWRWPHREAAQHDAPSAVATTGSPPLLVPDAPPAPLPTPVHSSLPVRRHPTAPVATQPTPHNTQHATSPTFHISRFTFHVPRAEALALGGLLLLSVLLRVWDLQAVPFAVHPDEFEMGNVALAAYGPGGPNPSIFSTLWATIDLPAVWFVAVAAALDLGGGTLAALRLPAALFGAATILPFYGLVRDTWGRTAALAGGAIFAFSAANVHYSRQSVNNIVTPFFWAACFYFLLRGVRRGRPVDWALAGIAGGLGEYSFYGTRLLPFILLAFGLYLLVVHWRQGWRMVGHFALLVLGYLVAFGPLFPYLLDHPAIYFGRGAGKLTWDHVPRSMADVQAMWQTLWPLVAENLQGFSVRASQDGFYWSPLLLLGEAALLVIGTALLIWHWRHPAAFLVLLAGAGVLFVGGTLVRGTPYPVHWTPAFPMYYAAIAVPLGAWGYSWARAAWSWRMVGVAVLVAGLLADAGANAAFYARSYVEARPEFLSHVIGARWAADLGPEAQVYTVGRTWQALDPGFLRYLVQGQTQVSLLNPARDLPLARGAGHTTAFLFARDNAQYLPIVQAYYPGGSLQSFTSDDGKPLFDTYTVPAYTAPPPALPSDAGLAVSEDRGAGVTTRRDPFLGFTALGMVPPGARPDLLPPVRARWAGQLLVPTSGPYALELHSDGAALLVLDGDAAHGLCVAGSQLATTVDLAAGPHALQLDYSGKAAQRLLELYWTPPGGPRTLVPPTAFRSDEAAPALPSTLPCGSP